MKVNAVGLHYSNANLNQPYFKGKSRNTTAKTSSLPNAVIKSALLGAAILGGLIYKGKLFPDKKLSYQAQLALKKAPNIVKSALDAKIAAKNNLNSVLSLINQAKGKEELVLNDKLVKFSYQFEKPVTIEEFSTKTNELLRKTTINDKFFEITNYKNGTNSFLINKDKSIASACYTIAKDKTGENFIKHQYNFNQKGLSLKVTQLEKKSPNTAQNLETKQNPKAKFKKLYVFNNNNELSSIIQKEQEISSTINFENGKMLNAEIVNNDGKIKDFDFSQKSKQKVS